MFEIVWKRGFKVWLHPEFLFKMTKLAKVQNECLKEFHQTTDRVIQEKKAELERRAAENEYVGPCIMRKKVFHKQCFFFSVIANQVWPSINLQMNNRELKEYFWIF